MPRARLNVTTFGVWEHIQYLGNRARFMQKFCNHSFTGCRRNSATTHSPGVAEILRPLIHWVLQKFCNNSFTECGRNSATTHSQGITECHRNTVTTHTLDVAEILHPLIHQMLQKLTHGYRNITVFLQPVNNTCHEYSVN